jgi:hypothetical protein
MESSHHPALAKLRESIHERRFLQGQDDRILLAAWLQGSSTRLRLLSAKEIAEIFQLKN